MTTNYVLHKNVCFHCLKADHRFHIGHSAVGWKFLWRGYVDRSESPLPQPLTTREQWFALIRDPKNQVKDEYGLLLPAEDFIALVISIDQKKGAEEHEQTRLDSGWQDPEGCNFYAKEFS